MKSKIPFLVLLVLFLPIAGTAQDFGSKPLIVSLPEGGFVSFKNQTAWTDIRRAFDSQKLPGELGSQAMADQNQTIHRVLRDDDGKLIFGYDLWVSGDPAAKQFRIVVKPLDSEVEITLRAKNQPTPAETISTFPKSSAPQTLDDGAEFSLDLLINQSTGIKIIDVVKVTFDRSRLGVDRPGISPRDFSLEVVALEMKDYSLMVNDKLTATGKSKTGASGALLWIYIPNRGRFIFSLVPREGYLFQKSGTVAGNKIEFTVNGDHYQWLSGSAILREEGTWNLWVLHDPKYSPLLAVREPPTEEKKPLGTLSSILADKLKASAAALKQKPGALTVVDSKDIEKTLKKSRDVIMMGSADRIENLLPRN